MFFLLTRPEEESQKLAQSLIALGHGAHCDPLLKIDQIKTDKTTSSKITSGNFQAVLFTSANGVRAFARTAQPGGMPCYAVGASTAEEARAAGFHPVFTAAGNVVTLAQLVCRNLQASSGPLLHISGLDIAGNLSGILEAAGFQLVRIPLYKATKAAALSPVTCDMITSGQITHIPFYSPRTAEIFIALARRAGLQEYLTAITALCLSSAVSDVINSLSWHKILTAQQPDQTRLFNLIGVTLEEKRQ